MTEHELTWNDWSTDTASTDEVVVNGDTFNLDTVPDSGNLYAHYRAHDLSASDGSSISSWAPRKDEDGNDLTLSGSATYRASAIDGGPAVEFDGSSDEMSAGFASDQSLVNTVYIVGKHLNLGSTGTVQFAGSNSTDGIMMFIPTEVDAMQAYSGSFLTNGVSYDTNPHIFACTFNGSDSYIAYDGSETNGDTGLNGPSDGIILGARADGSGDYWNGQVSEVLYYNAWHDATQRQDVYEYLAGHWGITLS